ncbi:DUF2235 domain-containing protein, partial [Streptomyces sp. NPDC005568]|uniref:phospholipase effector Tle1 domain-containing protein n=1 Tax=Streptomyces sp. NPDC005568 TaxID=3156887 RepID=UPI0033BC2B2A
MSVIQLPCHWQAEDSTYASPRSGCAYGSCGHAVSGAHRSRMARPDGWWKHGGGATRRSTLSRGGMVMAKRLVVCCDGTWNYADQPSKTNVAKVALSVRQGSAVGKVLQVQFTAYRQHRLQEAV